MSTPDARDDAYALSPVKFSRLSKRGLMLGLSGPQLACLAVAIFTIVASLYTTGATGLAILSVVWLPAIAVAVVGVQGRKLTEWAPITFSWIHRTLTGRTMHLTKPSRPVVENTLTLPGDSTTLHLYIDAATGAAMVHDQQAQTLTAVVEVTHPSFVLLDPVEQQRRVQAWGRVLATCCRSGRIARVQVMERTLPDSGTELSDWWAEHGHDDGTFTSRVYRELIGRAGPASERHVATVGIALDMKTAHRAIRGAGGGKKGAVAVLGQEMNTLATALRAADLNPTRWFTPADLALAVRTAYDPAAARRLEQNPDIGREVAGAGPMGVREEWASLRTDSSFHATLWISQWPQAHVFPGFLAPLLLTSGIRRSFSLVAMPMRADVAARDIRRKKTEYIADQAQRAKIGQIEDAQQTAEYRDVLQQEADLVGGHGICRYTGLITVSAATDNDLQAALAAVEQAAVQASCETRLLVGQQASAFTVAALPLCRVV